MFRNFIYALLLIISGTTYSSSTLSPNAYLKDFEEKDKKAVNEFCIHFKQDLIKPFALVNNRDLSESGFITFGSIVRNSLYPGLKQFLKELEDRGAQSCNYDFRGS